MEAVGRHILNAASHSDDAQVGAVRDVHSQQRAVGVLAAP